MTIAFVAQAENSVASGTASLAASPALTVSAGDALEVQVLFNIGQTFTINDGGVGNTYVLKTSVNDGTSNQINTYVAQNCAAASTTITITSGGSNVSGVYVKQITGVSTSAAVVGTPTSNFQSGGPGSGANVIVSGNVAVGATPINVLVSGFTCNLQGSTPVATAGTSPLAFVGRTPVWSVFGAGTADTVPEDLRVVGATGNVQATFGCAGGGSQFSNMITAVVVYAEAAATSTAPIAWTS
jgi:hypothetical protein